MAEEFNRDKHRELTKKAMAQFHSCAQSCNTKEELSVFAAAMAGLGIAMLRGIEGGEFVDGFLSSAKAEKNPLVIKPELIN